MRSTDVTASLPPGSDHLVAFAGITESRPSRSAAVLDAVACAVLVLIGAPLLVVVAAGARVAAWALGEDGR